MNKSTLPRPLRRYAGRIESVSDERCYGDGCWVTLKAGWMDNANPQCHTIHEDTFAACVPMVADAVPCTCRDCRR